MLVQMDDAKEDEARRRAEAEAVVPVHAERQAQRVVGIDVECQCRMPGRVQRFPAARMIDASGLAPRTVTLSSPPAPL